MFWLSEVGASGAAVTARIPATGSNIWILNHLSITLYNAAARTGGATPVTVTTTNLGGLAFTFSTSGAIGTEETQVLNPRTRSRAAGVDITIVCPATTGAIWRVNANWE